MPNAWIRFFLLALTLQAAGLCSCGERKAKIVETVVAERLNAFRQKQQVQCRENLLSEAGRMVDSLLLTDAQIALRDSLARTRPGRPPKPIPLPPIDTAVVKPLFDQ